MITHISPREQALSEQIDEQGGQLAAWRDRAIAAEAERDELRIDAERYRWIRDGDLCCDHPYPVMREGIGEIDRSIWFEELDDAIDAAMKGSS